MAVEDLEAVIKGSDPLDGEAEWFRSRFRVLNLVPSLMIEYRRRAFVAPCGGRVTIDDQIRARRVSRDFQGFDAESKHWMITDHAILEVKGPIEPSPLMQEVADRIQLSTQGFSKYCFGLEAAGLEFRNGKSKG